MSASLVCIHPGAIAGIVIGSVVFGALIMVLDAPQSLRQLQQLVDTAAAAAMQQASTGGALLA